MMPQPSSVQLPRLIVAKTGHIGTDGLEADSQLSTASTVERMPVVPKTLMTRRTPVRKPVPVKAGLEKDNINLNFEKVPLTNLIQVVYSEILGRSVNIDPKIMERRDIVTFKTPDSQTSSQVDSAIRLLLKSYGIFVRDVGDLVQVVPDSAETGYSPEIRRGAALPETPDELRPVFQLVDLIAVRNTDVAGWLKTMFKDQVTVLEDPTRNALLLSGTRDKIIAAIDAVRVLDQPVMQGRSSLRITPIYWTVESLAAQLKEVLASEGYAMPPANYSALSGGIRYPVLILPVSAANTLLVFSMSDKIIEHVQDWVSRLDQPSERGAGKGFFTYTAQNVSAEELAKTLTQLLLGGSGSSTGAQSRPAATGDAPAAQAKKTESPVGVVFDTASNTLIFQTSAEEYGRLEVLLRALDKPSKSALIELTVAEVTLTDDTELGVEWLVKGLSIDGKSVAMGTLGGLSAGTAGLLISSDKRFVINALATSNRATILSSPHIIARNGEQASIQVGQEVPIITSQQSNISAATATGSGVLQTIQYRNTGVILTVTPVIHSNNRVDLEVKQEVSAAQSTSTGVNNSPTFASRKVETRLTLQSGSTVLLGGLISNDNTDGNAGIPWLKDIPGLGYLFRTQTDKKKRTELIVLITPYILSDDNDVQAVTQSFKDMLPLLRQPHENTKPVGKIYRH